MGLRRLNVFFRDESGATAIEYALIASVISMAILGTMLLISGEMSEMYEYIRTNVQDAVQGAEGGQD